MKPVSLRYHVQEMDCPTCARKVETALRKLPGVSDVTIQVVSQSITLTLDEEKTERAELIALGKRIGHTFHMKDTDGTMPRDEERVIDDPWYRSEQGRAVLWSGTLLILAFIISVIRPGFERHAFSSAAILGALPLLFSLFHQKSWQSLGSIECLAVIAAFGAVAIDAAAEGATVIFLFTLGEMLEGIALSRTRNHIRALADLTPKTAQLCHETGQMETVPANSLRVGQTIFVRPGERIPTDGLIIEGSSGIDESALTGESAPVFKQISHQVFAGSVNTDGALMIRVEKTARDNTIARIIRMIEDAEAERSPTARFIDRFSRIYTPLVVVFAVLIATLPPLFFGQGWHEWLYRALTLLLIACPCALVISVPAAVVAAIGGGARHGLLIKGGAALETLAHVTTVAFDKTGTLTLGRFSITTVTAFEGDERKVVTLAASIERGSTHPLALAITTEAERLSLAPHPVTAARAEAGKYAEAVINGRRLFIGSPRFVPAEALRPSSMQTTLDYWESEGQTALVLWDDSRVLGLIAMRDTLRTEAPHAMTALRKLGVRPLILTGDNARAAKSIATALKADVTADLLPDEKLSVIRTLQETETVAMVGDGINDAPALARADVGIAMGHGTALALETAHAALLRNDLQGVAELIRLARAAMDTIKQNITAAIGLKALFLALTLLGYTHIWMAVLADTGTMFLVTLNALRLLIFHPTPKGS